MGKLVGLLLSPHLARRLQGHGQRGTSSCASVSVQMRATTSVQQPTDEDRFLAKAKPFLIRLFAREMTGFKQAKKTRH